MVCLGSTWKPVTIPALFGMSESFSVPYDTILQLFWCKVSPDRVIFPGSKLSLGPRNRVFRESAGCNAVFS